MDSMVELLSQFKNKRVLITGDTGFKGSWLALWLKELGADVFGYSLPPKTSADHFNVIGLDKKIQHIDGNILDYKMLSSVFNEFKPEILFHLAAQPLVRYSYQEPKETFDTNISGSVNILEMVRKSSSLKSVVFVTSDKCYKNKEWIWGYRENEELGGHDPYSASKAAAEIVFSSYMDSFFSKNTNLGLASVRAGNVIGGGDWSSDRIIPDTIKSLNDKKHIIIRNPEATRPWQHVLEPLSGYLLLAVKLYQSPANYRGAWNFGPLDSSFMSVKNLVEKVVDYWGSGIIEIKKTNDNLHEAGFLHLNCDKAHRYLNWAPRWNFDETVFKTVEWYKNDKESKENISIKQIHDYMEKKND